MANSAPRVPGAAQRGTVALPNRDPLCKEAGPRICGAVPERCTASGERG